MTDSGQAGRSGAASAIPSATGLDATRALWRSLVKNARHEPWQAVWASLVYVPLYVLFEALTYGVVTGLQVIVPWNPLPALAVVLVAWGGLRYVPAVFIGVLLSDIFLRDQGGTGVVIAAAVVATAYSVGGYLLRRLTRIGESDPSPRDLSIFIAVALGCAVLAAVADAVVNLIDLRITVAVVARDALERMTGIMVGLVVVGPLLLQTTSGSVRAAMGTGPERRRTLRRFVLFVLMLAAILLVIFGVRPLDEYRMFYLLFLPALAVAMRYGLAGAAVAVGLVQCGLLLALAVVEVQSATALEFQILMLSMAITILYVGALAGETARQSEALAARARELRQQSEALAEAQKVAATAELAGALAHELNQPLSAITNYARACRTLAEREGGSAVLTDSLGRIAEESSRAGEFVRRMRDFFRTGMQREEICRIEPLLNAALAQAADRIERLGVVVRVRCPVTDLAVRVDRVQFGTVLANLVKNALDSLADREAGRHLDLLAEARLAQGELVLRIAVTDNGPGVAEDLRAELFSAMATSKPQGMGLGLAISRSIVERHGGRLWLDSASNPTRFCMELPLAAPAAGGLSEFR